MGVSTPGERVDLFINDSLKDLGILICQFVDRWLGEVQYTAPLSYAEHISPDDLARVYLDYVNARPGDKGECSGQTKNQPQLTGTIKECVLPLQIAVEDWMDAELLEMAHSSLRCGDTNISHAVA